MNTIARTIAAAVLAIASISAHADEWTGQDKTKHVIAGALIAAPVSMLTDSWRAGAASGCAVGVLKEINDMRTTNHTPSYKDAVVTCVGAAVGAQLGVMIAPVRGGVWVGKAWAW